MWRTEVPTKSKGGQTMQLGIVDWAVIATYLIELRYRKGRECQPH
jgi:hypothetical protein